MYEAVTERKLFCVFSISATRDICEYSTHVSFVLSEWRVVSARWVVDNIIISRKSSICMGSINVQQFDFYFNTYLIQGMCSSGMSLDSQNAIHAYFWFVGSPWAGSLYESTALRQNHAITAWVDCSTINESAWIDSLVNLHDPWALDFAEHAQF